MILLCRYASRVLLSCNLLYHAVHVDSLSAGGASPPMATECVDYDLSLLFEFLCQVRRYQPPFENLVVRIDKGIHVFLVDFTCADEFFHHLVLSVKHMQICNAFCPCFSVHIFRFYIQQGGGALICLSGCTLCILQKFNIGLFPTIYKNKISIYFLIFDHI